MEIFDANKVFVCMHIENKNIETCTFIELSNLMIYHNISISPDEPFSVVETASGAIAIAARRS